MASYAAIPMRAGSAAGFGGGTFGLLGGVGPAWNDAFNTAMATAQNWYNLQNRVMMDQYQIPAQAAAYDAALQDSATKAILGDTKKDVTQWLATTQQHALTDQVMQALGLPGNQTYPQNQPVITPQQQHLQYVQNTPPQQAVGPMTTQQNINARLGSSVYPNYALGLGGR